MASDRVKIAAIVGVVALESLALWRGVDGVFFGVAVAAIAGIAGYTVGRAKR